VCLKCLEKDPARRYPAATELAADLMRFLDGQPVTAVPLGARERLARHAARDGYEIVAEIGRGPRSIVYHARYDTLKHSVAVKVFPEGTWTREEWDARLQRGAALWSALSHPHIVPVQRAGWWDGSPYVVTEYVAHGSLAATLTGRPQSIRQALQLVLQLGEVVCYLHRQGVVHANLKPSNVLFASDGIPRVADFHQSAGLFQTRSPAADPTGLGYVAPECLHDPTAEPRPHTDVYGLGLILYELLCGRPPFAGATADEVREQVTLRDPVLPSALNADVPQELEWLVLRCLRKNPWRRFMRAYDVVSKVRKMLDEAEGRVLRS
jgi:serine/threonine protein kinase